MALGDRIDNRQSKPDAARRARARRIGAREPVEDPPQRLLGYAAAFVLHLDHHPAEAIGASPQLDRGVAAGCT